MMVTSVNRDTISAIHTHQESRDSPRTNNADSATGALSSSFCLLWLKTTKLYQESRAINLFMALSILCPPHTVWHFSIIHIVEITQRKQSWHHCNFENTKRVCFSNNPNPRKYTRKCLGSLLRNFRYLTKKSYRSLTKIDCPKGPINLSLRLSDKRSLVT